MAVAVTEIVILEADIIGIVLVMAATQIKQEVMAVLFIETPDIPGAMPTTSAPVTTLQAIIMDIITGNS